MAEPNPLDTAGSAPRSGCQTRKLTGPEDASFPWRRARPTANRPQKPAGREPTYTDGPDRLNILAAVH
jgi:hypothetical protein